MAMHMAVYLYLNFYCRLRFAIEFNSRAGLRRAAPARPRPGRARPWPRAPPRGPSWVVPAAGGTRPRTARGAPNNA